MKKEEVPQDKDNLHEGTFKQIMYAVDNSGNYVQVQSAGWEPENIALDQAWEEVNKRIEAAKQKVLAGEVSPIAYYMEKNIMDLALLANYVGKFQWQVKRHMKPAVFRRLSQHMLQKYADAFKVSIADLQHIK
ncbi:hypothetical protein SAMN05444266_101376 [Chitinophaga jiangningensis]|uniref:HTH cro/C1-type domain-containing protein n=1 Tax=Chitinophaga jiangningensis TaxID=1419482 RepID=A0A1M6VVP6_9BACT|nr:hypothetical protein [Chitinophaga jiangningensis]SHK85445.1 hypothetical protein SAMN05444266_101376 [Chitinophaga jiangningensis]